MKVKQKKIMSLFLAMLMLFSVLPAGTMTASAAITLSTLQSKYPNGKYWNSGNADTYTSSPHTGESKCKCTSYRGKAWQCHGFACQLGYLVSGIDFYDSRWIGYTNSSVIDSVKPGDMVRYKNDGHTIFITGVNGDTITYADCNSDGYCKIRWNETISKSTLKSTFTKLWKCPVTWNPGSGTHTHSYSGSYFEASHPHKVYQKCSCGVTKYTGATRAYASCSTCMKLSTAYVMPVKAYTINTGKTTVYSSVNGTAKSNKIYDTDLCTISQIWKD